MSRLKEKYHKDVKADLLKKFAYSNPMKIPSVTKIVINMGIAELAQDKNALQDAINEFALIAGQKPIITKAKKSIANFKLREGSPVGVMVTLRGIRMFEFLDRFFNIVCPRIRDFRGFETGTDKHGNCTVGLNDHSVFPELNLDKVKDTKGMNITFVTTAESDDECIELLRLMGMPFKNYEIVVT
ncbi:MAG: 50S ribosomal protein L5 [Chlamydiae bacterium]|nr:50S ribosomal protein L5 [Chlamydiota bacterium]